MRTLSIACVAAGLLGAASLPASAALSSADRDFVQKAASSGMAEVQAAQMAQQKGSSPQVKQFASRMITDHTQANTELQQIAEQANVTVPAQPVGKDAAEGKRLNNLNGAAFDQAYAQDEVRDHEEAVSLFRKEAQSGQDTALKAFAQKTLPILEQHLQMAQALHTSR